MSGRKSQPFTTFPRPDLCADHGHPPTCFNPWQDGTWCLCGARVRPGDHVPAVADTGLTQWWPDVYRLLLANPEPLPDGWAREPGTYCLVSDRPEPRRIDLFGAAA